MAKYKITSMLALVLSLAIPSLLLSCASQSPTVRVRSYASCSQMFRCKHSTQMMGKQAYHYSGDSSSGISKPPMSIQSQQEGLATRSCILLHSRLDQLSQGLIR